MAFPWAAAISGAVGLFGARSQKKALREQAEAIERAALMAQQQTEELTRPYREMTQFAFPLLRSAAVNIFGKEVGRESPYLKAERETTLRDIGRETERGLATSRGFWGRQGNIGRARGEELRIKRAGEEAGGETRLRYGLAEEGRQERARGGYADILTNLAGIGQAGVGAGLSGIQTGLAGRTGAAGLRSEATGGFWSDLGLMAGEMWGQEQAKREGTEQRKWWEQILGIGKPTEAAGTTTGGVKPDLSKYLRRGEQYKSILSGRP